MTFTETFIKDLFVVEPVVHGDSRGWFSETYNLNQFEKHGIHLSFVQDNHSFSLEKGVLRGLHVQNDPYAQTKLIRCTKGKIFDVAVDLRPSSQTYLKWFGIELTEENHKMLLVPKGFAHGFLTLVDHTEVQYKVDQFYNKESDRSIKYNDPLFNIAWPVMDYQLSDKDKQAKNYQETDINFK